MSLTSSPEMTMLNFKKFRASTVYLIIVTVTSLPPGSLTSRCTDRIYVEFPVLDLGHTKKILSRVGDFYGFSCSIFEFIFE